MIEWVYDRVCLDTWAPGFCWFAHLPEAPSPKKISFHTPFIYTPVAARVWMGVMASVRVVMRVMVIVMLMVLIAGDGNGKC